MNKIDVIIPIKGRPHMLRERSLRSLLSQNFTDFKVTIVDDASSEEDFQKIQSIAEEYRNKGLQIDVVKNEGTEGAAGTRNFGLDCTSGEYVLWFDSDDILLENKLELSMKLIQSGDSDLAITRAQHVLNDNLIEEFWGDPVAPNRGTYEFHFPYQTMCALYRRSFLDSSKTKWHENIKMMDDWLFSNEVMLKTDNWVFSPAVTAHYFVPDPNSDSIGSMMTRGKIKSQFLAIKTLKKAMKRYNLRFSIMDGMRIIRHQIFLVVSYIYSGFPFFKSPIT